MRRFVLAVLVAGLSLSPMIGAAASGGEDLSWAYPGVGPAPAAPADPNQRVTIPGSAVRFTNARTGDMFATSDWRPASHPAMPAVVAHGHEPKVMACGYCHLPDGQGRPENAVLAGLPRDYILRQVHHFASGERAGAVRAWIPTNLMSQVARAVSASDATAAADYFSRLRFTSRVHVEEIAAVPRPGAAHFLFAPGPGQPSEPLGARIVETPVSMERFERRDSRVDFTAYVPIGSLKRGAALAAGADGVQACAGCHGAGLRGGVGPPLAGRFPSYLFRQLDGFKTGARGGPDAAPMKAVTAALSTSDMIALAAHAASLRP